MNEVQTEDKPAVLVPMTGVQLLQVVALGAVIGLTVWGLTLFLEQYVFQAIVCQGSQSQRCAGGLQYGEAFANIIGAGIGLFFLVRIQIFRPLLVVIAALISLWGLISLTQTLPWYGVGLASVGLYTLTYMAYAWVARLRLFWLVVVLLPVLVVTVRLVLNS